MFAYLPLIPYKALHVLSIGAGKGAFSEQYQFVPLRMSARIVLKAFLNRWGNVLASFGLLLFSISMYASVTMSRPVNRSDHIFLTVTGTMFVVGLLCKAAWFLLTQKDEKIKNLIGQHAQGSSDPLDWTTDRAEVVIQSIVQQESQPSLVEVARKSIKEDRRTDAAFVLRLAMRDPNNFEAQDMMQRLLAE